MLPVCCLQLPGFAIKRLHDNGFTYAEDLFDANEELLVEVEKLFKSYPDIQDKLKECLKGPEKTTALALLEEERKCGRILTFSLRLDQLLGGGVPLGAILEVCGAPGSGKTQLCLQLCVSVQLHSSLGGVEGEAVYIDTDAGFCPQRIKEISQVCKEHCCNIARNKLPVDVLQVLREQSYNKYYYIAVQDHLQLLGTVLGLENFIKEHPKVKLVVIDSLAFPFLHLNDMLKRTSKLCKLIQCLEDLCQCYNLSVVVTNHLTTRISRGEDQQLVPALGECVGHLINNRLIIGFLSSTNHFAGVIFKSPSLQSSSAEFKVTKGGIRDIHCD